MIFRTLLFTYRLGRPLVVSAKGGLDLVHCVKLLPQSLALFCRFGQLSLAQDQLETQKHKLQS